MVNRRLTSIILYILFASSLWSQTLYYESTQYGLPIREISSGRVEEFEFVLVYQKTGSRVVRRLLQDSAEIRKWERLVKWKDTYTETEFEKRDVVNRSFVEGGLLVKEEIYFEGQVSEIRIYHYSRRELIKTTIQNAAGEILYTNKYLTSSNGRLTRVVREEPNKTESVYSYQYSENELLRMVSTEEDYTVTYRYISGHLFSMEKKQNDEVIYYKEEPIEGVRKTIENDFLIDLKIESSYDSDGNILKKIKWKGSVKTISLYRYRDDRLSEKLVRGKGYRDRYTYSYDSEGDLLEKVQYRDELILRSSVYSAPSDYIERVYRDGVPLFELVYRDNVKISTTLINQLEPSEELEEDLLTGDVSSNDPVELDSSTTDMPIEENQ